MIIPIPLQCKVLQLFSLFHRMIFMTISPMNVQIYATDKITAINGFVLNGPIKHSELESRSGWVSYTRNNLARMKTTLTSATFSKTSMYRKDKIYNNASAKPLPPTRIYAPRKEADASEVAAPTIIQEEEDTIELVLPAATITDTPRKHRRTLRTRLPGQTHVRGQHNGLGHGL